MVKVVKRDKKIQPFRASKIAKACIGSGVPKPLAEAIAAIISKKVSGKKLVKSSEIKQMIFSIFDTFAKAKKHWIAYKKK